MARVQTIVQLNSELIAALDAEAEAAGASRSAIIRHAITDHLDANRGARIDAALVSGYKAIPQDARDEWGSAIDQSRRSTRRTLERLDAEEDAAGLTW
ncbi:MAG: ribbon-helix-helix protein, CopG family [Actinomycetota bacterium]|nr:ribbon-helix-helix protein, CopG family [Actinomycetota bacterium]